MYESVAVVGERGQITIPKNIRDLENIKPKDRVIVKIENDRIVVEKALGKAEKERLMVEGYKKMGKQGLELEGEMRHVSKEADAMLDEY
ncbi:MAG: AbrB/MazE/SpoVT family DNA-binding domain-containing protein [Candidatus Diapherotrites archaeon]|nr:AbrB/MazE/SpoVT family DNA-binding domain-containing protein [Candidatus Diapherotrites archaeon]